MLIKLLNGSSININLKKYVVDRNGFSKSKFQKKIRDKLIKQHPLEIICEELYVPVEKFYLDFFLPGLSLVIEANGHQHQFHTRFFHKTKIDFHKQQDTDRRKKEWCLLNNFKFVAIYDK
jgi:hypothetical protein